MKTRSAQMAKFLGHQKAIDPTPRMVKLHADLTGCANYLVFHNYYTIDQIRLVKASTCKRHLLCPFCAARRASKMMQMNLEKFHQVLSDNPGLKPVMITLTIKNGDDLAERVAHLNNSFRKLLQTRRDAKKGKSVTEFSKVAGAVYSQEITNKENGWHPHIHMVAFLTDWIDQAELSREWQSITGDSFILDIRRIKSKGDNSDLVSASLEVFKYALKFQDMSLEKNFEAYEVLRGRRLIASFGNLRGVEVPDNLLDDPLADLPYLELFYKYMPHSRSYSLQTAKESPPPCLTQSDISAPAQRSRSGAHRHTPTSEASYVGAAPKGRAGRTPNHNPQKSYFNGLSPPS